MTLGELNYESDFIPDVKLHYPLAANAVFVFFCLAMPIILMNMLVSNLLVLNYFSLLGNELLWLQTFSLFIKSELPLVESGLMHEENA